MSYDSSEEVLFVIALKPGVMELLWLVLIPAVLIAFSVVIGISVNIKLHNFDWEKEEAVVKQSASAMLGGMAGLFAAIVCVGIVLTVPEVWSDAAKGVVCVMLIAVAAVLYRANNKVELQKL